MVQKLRPFYWRGGFCLLVELHREGSAPAACAVGLFTRLLGFSFLALGNMFFSYSHSTRLSRDHLTLSQDMWYLLEIIWHLSKIFWHLFKTIWHCPKTIWPLPRLSDHFPKKHFPETIWHLPRTFLTPFWQFITRNKKCIFDRKSICLFKMEHQNNPGYIELYLVHPVTVIELSKAICWPYLIFHHYGIYNIVYCTCNYLFQACDFKSFHSLLERHLNMS